MADWVDKDGYRKNVGIIVCNHARQVLWARRSRHDGWQFPQGGVEPDESPHEAAFRELYEELGLARKDVKLLGRTGSWLRYDVPHEIRLRRYLQHRPFRGQKQKWFLFQLIAGESRVRLDISENPEFDCWIWVDYWQPLNRIVEFKRQIYKKALTELEPLLNRGNSYS